MESVGKQRREGVFLFEGTIEGQLVRNLRMAGSVWDGSLGKPLSGKD